MMENDKNFKLDFIGIGSGKSGSTWLYKCLIEHPEICDYNPKEINYFSYLFDSHNKEWYFKQFEGCRTLIKGEFSVSYMEDPTAAERIKALFPSVKLIAILRNPVDKIFSNFRHSIRKGEIQPELSFIDYIKEKDHLAPGLYARQLEPYFRIFDPANIYLIILEEFNQNIIRNMRNL